MEESQVLTEDDVAYTFYPEDEMCAVQVVDLLGRDVGLELMATITDVSVDSFTVYDAGLQDVAGLRRFLRDLPELLEWVSFQ